MEVAAVDVITVYVRDNGIRVAGLDPLRSNDLCQDAPEPPERGLGDLRATIPNLLYVFEKLPEAVWDDPKSMLMEARALRYMERLQDVEPGEYEKSWPFKQEPRPFQLKIFARARHMTAIALAPVVMGAGKTKILLDVAADKYMRGEIDCVAIIAAPRGVHRQWIEEAIPKSLTDDIKYIAAVWSPTRQTPERVMRPYGTPRLRFLAFNIGAFSTASGKAAMALRQFMNSGRCMLIEDESSRIKNHKAARTKALIGETKRGKKIEGLARYAVVRAIASGTPITKGIEDLWSQYEFLDPDIIGMSNYYAFQARYCVTQRPPGRNVDPRAQVIVGYRNTEEFVNKIAKVTFVVPKSALGLPEKSFEELPVELTREQKMIYNAIRNKLVDDLKDRRITLPNNAAVRYLRLQQVLCGRVYEDSENDEEPPISKDIPSNRVSTLLEWRELHPGPAVIWCRFHKDIEDVFYALNRGNYKPVCYYGETSDEDRALAKRAFREGFATDFIGTAASAGMGVDGLQDVCEQAIYYSSTFSREHRWQSEDRIHRIGMKGNASYTDMVVPRSVDRMILDSYKETADLIASVMSHPDMIPILE